MFKGEWPFAVVPTAQRAQLWAGRHSVRAQLDAMASRWRRRHTSEIVVMWADFGQGKTHSLLYIQGQVDDERTITHYVQLPPLTTGSPFVALYRQLLRDFPLERLARSVYEHFRLKPNELAKAGTAVTRPLLQLLWIVATSAPGHDAASRWLRAEKVAARDVADLTIAGKRLSIGPAPSTAQECQNNLDALLSLIVDFPSADTRRAVLLIDEFQRIGELPPRKRLEVCDSLHLLFNKHPNGLRLVLAFAGGMPEIVDHVLTPDLQSRVNTRLDLAPMTEAAAREYLVDLLTPFAAPDRPYGPYRSDAVSAVVAFVSANGETSPRRINIGFDLVTNAVLDRWAATGRDESGVIELIDVQRAIPSVRNQLRAALEESA